MSEIRKDPASPTWVVLAAERGKRPSEFPKRTAIEPSGRCPLCEELNLRGLGAGEGEEEPVYVLDNKYPAVKTTLELAQGVESDFYHYLSGFGGHEVVVETPAHKTSLASMSPSQIAAVLGVYRERFRHWRRDPRIAYILVFRNYRAAAGASVSHPHSQIISVPMIPHRVAEELHEARVFFDQNNCCVYCQTIEIEEEAAKRVVIAGKSIFAHTPYASRFPYEMRIMPRRHSGDFEGISDAEIEELALTLSDLTQRLKRLLDDPAFNLLVHVAPVRTLGLVYYHWHLELIPRLTMPAGFEWASGVYINPQSPEEAADQLRQA